MYVACPSCKSLYPIEPDHLRAAHGKVRCGNCQLVFDATDAVCEDAQEALEYAELHQVRNEVMREVDEMVDSALNRMPPEPEAPQPELGVVEQPREEAVAEAMPVPPEPGPAIPADTDFQAWPVEAEFAWGKTAPYLEEQDLRAILVDADEPERRGHRTWATVAASLVLIVLLTGQLVWAERYRLVANPSLRPALEWFCGTLGCDLPLRHDPASIEMAEREVRDHPWASGALLINAAFVNKAPWRQAWPVFEVSFSDVSGNRIAARRFYPEEYLDPSTDSAQGMAPGERAHVVLEVVDPGDKASSFQFEFM